VIKMGDKSNPDFSASFEDLSYIQDSDLLLMEREKQEINATVYNIVWMQAIAQKIFPTIPIRKGMKEHKLTIAKEPSPPLFTQDFLKEALDKVRRTENTYYVVYMHKDFQLSKVTIDASRSQKYYNMDARLLHIRVITRTMASYKERVWWRGFDIGGKRDSNGDFAALSTVQSGINANSVGILNTSGINTFVAGAGGDAKCGSAGDGPFSLAKAMAGLIADEYYGPYDVILSPLLYAQFILNRNSTTFQTDLERMLSMVDKNKQGIVRKLWVSPFLMNATDSGINSSMCVLQRMTPDGEPTVVLGEEYPIRHYPMTQNAFGIKGKIIWAGIPMVIRPLAINLETDINAAGT